MTNDIIKEKGLDNQENKIDELMIEEELEDYDLAPIDVDHILILIKSWPKKAKARYLIEIAKIISKTEEMNGAMFQVAAIALDSTVVLDKDYKEEIIMLCEKELEGESLESCYVMMTFLKVLKSKRRGRI
jgi:hypothetical protein